MTKTICVSGGFDPLHIGHLEMFREASKFGKLKVIINSDAWLLRKKGFIFLPWEQRAEIIKDLRYVAGVTPVDDTDDTVCEALRRIKPDCFANGGDRKMGNTPEVLVCQEMGIELLWNIGGGKANSSSEIALRAWVARPWGKYIALDEGDDYKVKKLVITPGRSISLQYHKHRSEFWYIASSHAEVKLDEKTLHVTPGSPPVIVSNGVKHQLTNIGNQKLVVIEIQSGAYLGEDDIIRIAAQSDVAGKHTNPNLVEV